MNDRPSTFTLRGIVLVALSLLAVSAKAQDATIRLDEMGILIVSATSTPEQNDFIRLEVQIDPRLRTKPATLYFTGNVSEFVDGLRPYAGGRFSGYCVLRLTSFIFTDPKTLDCYFGRNSLERLSWKNTFRLGEDFAEWVLTLEKVDLNFESPSETTAGPLKLQYYDRWHQMGSEIYDSWADVWVSLENRVEVYIGQ